MNTDIVEIAKHLQQLAAAKRLEGYRDYTEMDVIAYALKTHRIWIQLSEAEREYITSCIEIGESPFKQIKVESK